MNGVRIYVSNDINNNDIILNGEALDLFKDENIQITLKQTDIRDIATNYADFTQSFTVPATPKNNRIFRYWYDVNYDNQWESVSGIPCRIDIGGILFRKGTLKINSAQLDDYGNIKHYAIEFKANLKALKDKFGDTKIEQLNLLNVIPLLDGSGNKINEFFYEDSVVYTAITSQGNAWLEYPLISTKRLINDFDTIKYVDESTPSGINKSELRPAIKVRYLFDAIEDNYNVKFTGDFYDLNSPLDKMYLWLNRNEDVVTNVAQLVELNGTVTGDSTSSINYYLASSNPFNRFVTIERTSFQDYTLSVNLRIYTSSPTIPYKIYIQRIILNPDNTVDEIATRNQDNEGYVASHTDYVTGERILGFTMGIQNLAIGTKTSFRFSVESVGSLIVSSYKINATKYIAFFDVSSVRKTLTSSSGFTMIPKFNINRSLPEISIYDFFTSFVKMFNLVILPITDPVKLSELQATTAYQLEYYTNYYGKLDEVDITNYTNKPIKINKVNNFKKIEFKHADSSYGTNIMYKSFTNPIREYGSFISQPTFKTDEAEYKIETKFNVLIWRELPNTYEEDDDYTLNQTWLIADGLDEQFEKGVYNKPVIFFSNGQSNFPDTSKRIGYVRENGVTSTITNYNIFSNIDSLDILNYTTALTFSKENEFQTQESFYTDKNLFTNNYSDLLTGLYSPYAREYEVKATLPKHIYTRLNLGSQIIIRNQRYNITDITLNLINGEAKLKLNNVIGESNIIGSGSGTSSTSFSIDTISNIYYPSGDFTEKEIRINYPVNASYVRWRADYSIGTSASGYKVSFTTTSATALLGLLWYDYYDSSTIGNHTTSINQFIPVGTYEHDFATAYTSPITGYMRAKTGNSLTITVIAYDENDVALAQTSVTV